MDNILVTGATGQVGSAVVEALVRNGIHVRAAARKISGIVATEHIEPNVFDYEKPELYDSALSGTSGVFLVAPPLDLNAPAKLIPFIDRAVLLKVPHIVFLSVLGANAQENSPLRVIEKHLIASDIGHTIFRPNFFMENFTTGFTSPMVARGEITIAAGHGKTSFISVKDIAEATVRVFTKNLYGGDYDLTGLEALDYAQVAAIISSVSGRKIVYNNISEEIMLQGAREQGMPENALKFLAMLFATVRDGKMEVITSGVYELIGRAPTTFEEFARQNARHWEIAQAA